MIPKALAHNAAQFGKSRYLGALFPVVFLMSKI